MAQQTEQLKDKLTEWQSWMNSEDRFSITNQIHDMMLEDAIYRVVDRCLDLAKPAKKGGGVQINGMLDYLIFRGYYSRQMMGIRRLTEENKWDENRAIISLRRLLDDLQDHVSMLTRGNYFRAEQLPYDPDNSDRSYLDRYRAKGLHEDLDRLTGASPESRSEDDCVSPSIIHTLKSRLAGCCQRIKIYVDKNIAHAASPEVRNSVPKNLRDTTFEQLGNCHREICQITWFIRLKFLRLPGRDIMMNHPFGHLQYLDKPWIDSSDLPKVERSWDEYAKKINAWGKEWWPEEC